MLGDDGLCVCTATSGLAVRGWLTRDRSGERRYLEIMAPSGERSGVLVTLREFVAIEPLPRARLQAAE